MTSFEFKWEKSNTQVKGKVLARKRKDKSDGKSVVNLSDSLKLSNKSKNISPNSDEHKVSKQNVSTFLANKSQEKDSSELAKPANIKQRISTFRRNKSQEKDNFQLSKPFKDKQTFLVKRKQKKDKLKTKIAAASEENLDTDSVHESTKKFNPSKPHSLFSEKHKDVYFKTNIKGKPVIEKLFSKDSKFSDLNIHKYLVSNLQKINFVTLTSVQEKSIPVVLEGKNVLIRSQTGSGKTLAYAVPIVDALQNMQSKLQRTDGVQAIIIVPTRELALQAHEIFSKINTFQWIVVGHLCGGENRKTEKDRLRKGVHILIATPGRLLDHLLHTTAFKTDNVRCLVLDEADRLLDMGFKRDLVSIVEELDKSKTNAQYNPLEMLKRKQNKSNEQDVSKPEESSPTILSPLRDIRSKERQTLLLSATLNEGIAELASFTMKDHVYIDALDDTGKAIPNHMVIPDSVTQEFVITYVKHRLFTLSALLVAKTKQNSKVFVFMATSQMVDYHYELFTRCLLKMSKKKGKLKSGDVLLLDNVDSDTDEEEEIVLDTQFFKLHGSMDQAMRKQIFTEFRGSNKGVLLCTDVAARGLDVPTADCIIQYTGPQTDDDYLHRVGRTGRAGKSGSAIIFLTHEEQDYLSRLQEYKVYLKKRNPEDFLKYLCDLMDEPNLEMAATALMRRYETAVTNDKDLHRMACFAYTSWSRFYNTYPAKMRSIFNFKKVNLGHYVTSFALRDTPTTVAKVVRGQVSKVEAPRLNRKLATHDDSVRNKKAVTTKRKIKSVSLTTSEYSSGLETRKTKKKKK